MADRPEDPPPETPIARALRLRKAAQAARPNTPTGAGFDRKSAAAMPAGASKPWMKK